MFCHSSCEPGCRVSLFFAVRSPRWGFWPSTLFALVSIFASVDGDMRPAFTAWLARLFAFAAWLLSGTGYERSGPAKSDFGSALRAPDESLAMCCPKTKSPLKAGEGCMNTGGDVMRDEGQSGDDLQRQPLRDWHLHYSTEIVPLFSLFINHDLINR